MQPFTTSVWKRATIPLELLLSFLKNPKFKVRPLIKYIKEKRFSWARKIDWGYSVPCMATGLLNQHPRTVMPHMESETQEQVTCFFDSVTAL